MTASATASAPAGDNGGDNMPHQRHQHQHQHQHQHLPAASISPVSLRFTDQSTEATYTAAAASSWQSVDATVCLQKLVISSALFVPILGGIIASTPTGRLLWLAYLCALAAHLAVMRLLPKLYSRHRLAVLMPQKVLLAVVLTLFVPTFVLKRGDSTARFVELLVLGGGIVMQLCTGVIMPVPWRQHVPLALATFVAYNTLMLHPLVDVLMCSHAAVSHTAALYAAIDDTAYALGGVLMPHLMQRPKGASPRAQVYIVVLWLQLHVALLAPAFYLYYTESRSRWRFLQQQQQQQHATHSQPVTAAEAAAAAGPSSSSSSAAAALAETTTATAASAADASDYVLPPAAARVCGFLVSGQHIWRQDDRRDCWPSSSSRHSSSSSRGGSSGVSCADEGRLQAGDPGDAGGVFSGCIGPSQHLVLGVAFLALLMLLSWNVLHLSAGWLSTRGSAPDVWGLNGLVTTLAVKHGLAEGCLAL